MRLCVACVKHEPCVVTRTVAKDLILSSRPVFCLILKDKLHETGDRKEASVLRFALQEPPKSIKVALGSSPSSGYDPYMMQHTGRVQHAFGRGYDRLISTVKVCEYEALCQIWLT